MMRNDRRWVETRAANNWWQKRGGPSGRARAAGAWRLWARADGTAHLFLVFESLAGQRRGHVTERRTALDFAQVLRAVRDVQYPHAEKIMLVMDNLNTHKLASLYEAFTPAEARR